MGGAWDYADHGVVTDCGTHQSVVEGSSPAEIHYAPAEHGSTTSIIESESVEHAPEAAIHEMPEVEPEDTVLVAPDAPDAGTYTAPDV